MRERKDRSLSLSQQRNSCFLGELIFGPSFFICPTKMNQACDLQDLAGEED